MKNAKDYLSEANALVERVSVEEGIELHKSKAAIFIDVRDSSAVADSGTIDGALRIPRGFMEFAADPEIGFHYLGLSGEYHSICTGEIEYVNPESLGLLKEACQKIVKSFRVINLESIGTILLPDRYLKLKAILENKEEEKQKKLSKLIKENLITEII